MAKRKCVQRAIIELSDSEDDQAVDDYLIVKSNYAGEKNCVTSRSRKKASTAATTKVESSRIARIGPKGESPDVTVSKKRKFDEPEFGVTSSKIAKKDPAVIQSRKKATLQANNAKMGLIGSKARDQKIVRLGKTEISARRGIRIQHEAPKPPKETIFHQNRADLAENARKKQSLFHNACLLQASMHPLDCVPNKSETENIRSSAADKKSSAKCKPKSNETPETYLAGLAGSNVSCEEWTEIDYIQEQHGINKHVVENIVGLFKEDNTIPFIARYRRNMTQGMSADELRIVKDSFEKSKLIKQKASTIIKEIDKQGKWSPEFHALVRSTKSLNDLEHIQSMFKITKSTLAEKARVLGLDVPARAVMNGEKIDSLRYLVKSNTEGLKTEEQVRDGIVSILADTINKDKNTFEIIKDLRSRYSMTIETTVKHTEKAEKDAKSNKQKDDMTKYDLYHNFSSLETNLKPHQILAINRGESRKIVSVKVNIPVRFEQDFKGYCARQYEHACRMSPLHRTLLAAAFDHVWNKSIKSSIARRTRHELNEKAEIASMDVFAENVKQLLLTPPVRGKVVVGVDPGFRHGCKLAVVTEQGDVLATETIYPHDSNNPRANQEAERTLVRIVLAHKSTILALGNGTACRETEVFLANLIKKRAFEPLNVVYTIVDETGASIYSCGREASTEFPNLDVNVISAISIARRMQDPMAELVKIEPKHLGVGMYQHDLPEKQLAAKLNEVIMEAVSFVGVDVNTASVSLLKRVAGLGESKANSIIEWRKSSGPFRTRNDLKKVPRIGSKTFEQCAGFIRIIPETAVDADSQSKQNPFNYLDQTWIHPESYHTAKAFIKAAKCDINNLGTKSFISIVKSFADQGYEVLAKKFDTTAETIKIIVEGLSMEKGQDIRLKADTSMFRKSLTSFDDLKAGTVLTGVVRNNTHFGAFVDVGVERAGLIHKSQMGGMTLSVGQRVETKVQSIEKDRGRLGLTLIKCF